MDQYSDIMRNMQGKGIWFRNKPIIIGGLAMEYYGLRKCGEDFDFIITEDDYLTLFSEFYTEQKDVWGDLGFRIGDYEIYRSISLFDYDFYLHDAIELDEFYVLSIDKLLFTRVLGMKNEKYLEDLKLIRMYYYENLRNRDYYENAIRNYDLYCSVPKGIIMGGKYS